MYYAQFKNAAAPLLWFLRKTLNFDRQMDKVFSERFQVWRDKQQKGRQSGLHLTIAGLLGNRSDSDDSATRGVCGRLWSRVGGPAAIDGS
jgi:hypothetical protein